jgi:hypothetical protein
MIMWFRRRKNQVAHLHVQQIQRISHSTGGEHKRGRERDALDARRQEHGEQSHDTDDRHHPRVERIIRMRTEPLQLVRSLKDRRSHCKGEQTPESRPATSTVMLIDQQADREESAIVGNEDLLEDRRIDRQFVRKRDCEPDEDERVKCGEETTPTS